MRTRWCAVCGIVVLPSVALSQQTTDSWAICRGTQTAAAIQACSQIIESGREPAPKLAEAYLFRAFAHSDNGDFVYALADHNESIRVDPDNAALFVSRGWVYFNIGQHERALSDYNRAIDLAPRSAVPLVNRGLLFAQTGPNERALQDFDQAVQLENTNVLALYSRGEFLLRRGKFDEAQQDFARVLAQDSLNVQALVGRGLVSAALGNFDSAIRDYDVALRLAPSTGMAYYNRGLAYYYKADHLRARVDFDKALELKPQEGAIWIARGNLNFDAKEYSRAVSDYNNAIELRPTATVLAARATARLIIGQISGAIEDFSRAIQLSPEYHYAWYQRGIAYTRLRSDSAAVADFSRALEIKPNDPQSHFDRANALLLLNQYDGAIADYDKALALHPGSIVVHHNRGLALSQRKDYSRALIDFDVVLSVDSNDTQALVLRGFAREQLGNNDGALADFDRAIRIDPQNIPALLNRGAVLLSISEDRAIGDFTRVLQADPRNVEALAHRATAYFRRKDYQRALSDWQAALAVDSSRSDALYGRGVVRRLRGQTSEGEVDIARAFRIRRDIADVMKDFGVADIPPPTGSRSVDAAPAPPSAQRKRQWWRSLGQFVSAAVAVVGAVSGDTTLARLGGTALELFADESNRGAVQNLSQTSVNVARSNAAGGPVGGGNAYVGGQRAGAFQGIWEGRLSSRVATNRVRLEVRFSGETILTLEGTSYAGTTTPQGQVSVSDSEGRFIHSFLKMTGNEQATGAGQCRGNLQTFDCNMALSRIGGGPREQTAAVFAYVVLSANMLSGPEGAYGTTVRQQFFVSEVFSWCREDETEAQIRADAVRGLEGFLQRWNDDRGNTMWKRLRGPVSVVHVRQAATEGELRNPMLEEFRRSPSPIEFRFHGAQYTQKCRWQPGE